MAATNYFHNPKDDITQKDFIEEAFKFASTEYITALFLGDACPNKEEIADKLAYYSGIDKTYWLRHHLHMDMQKGFAHKLLGMMIQKSWKPTSSRMIQPWDNTHLLSRLPMD